MNIPAGGGETDRLPRWSPGQRQFLAKRPGLSAVLVVPRRLFAVVAVPATPRHLSLEVGEVTRHFRESSLLDLFRELHDPAAIAASLTRYMNMLLPPGGQGIYEHADLATHRYKRNLRVFTNLNRVVRPGGRDRVLLLIGSGQLYILNDLVKSVPYDCVVDPLQVWLLPDAELAKSGPDGAHAKGAPAGAYN